MMLFCNMDVAFWHHWCMVEVWGGHYCPEVGYYYPPRRGMGGRSVGGDNGVKLATRAAGAVRVGWRGHLVWVAGAGRPYFVDGTSTEMTDAEVGAFRRETGVVDAAGPIQALTGLEL